MTTVYNIKLVSQTNAIIVICASLVILFGCILLFFPHGIHNKGFSLLATAVYGLLTYCLWQIFATGRTQWTISDNDISMIWIRQFAFAQKDNITIEWNEIESISRGIDPNYYNLKIKLVSGQTLRFYHDTLTTRDDFREFLTALNDKYKLQKRLPT